MSDSPEIIEIKQILQAELDEVEAANKSSNIISVAILVIMGGYLLWANSQISILLDPEGMAEAATGVALESIPEVSESLSKTIIEGSPDMAKQASNAVVGLIPIYRQRLEQEIKPVVDEVTAILADSAVNSALSSSSTSSEALRQEAQNAASEAVVSQLDDILQEAMDVKNENGETPREAVSAAIADLDQIDAELKKIASGQGDPQERELLLTWMNLLTQYQDQSNELSIP
jgi:hypothetical protein